MSDELLGTETTPEVVSTEQETVTPETEVVAKATETVVETAETTEAVEAKPKVVPLAALHEERERRKELATKLEEAERRNAADMGRLQERVNIILQTIQQAAEPPAGSDDPLFIQQFMAANPGVSRQVAEEAFFKEEPNNYFKYRQDLQDKRQSQLEDVSRQHTQTAQVQQQFSNFVSSYQAQAAEFSGKTLDFKEAYNFLLTNRDAELQAMGFVDPTQRRQIMQNEEIGIVQQAFQGKVNPAQRLYEIAKFRGYKPAEPSAASPGSSAPDLTQEKKAAAATKSLGAVPGSATGKMTAETLLSMSEEEFAKATTGNNWQKFFQGSL